jgi:hypothetical protein
MSRKFIASIMAATLAITALTSKPAEAASNDDIARILAGAATVFIIGKAIQSSNDHDNDGKRKHSAKKRHYEHDHRSVKSQHSNRTHVIIKKPSHKDRYQHQSRDHRYEGRGSR